MHVTYTAVMSFEILFPEGVPKVAAAKDCQSPNACISLPNNSYGKPVEMAWRSDMPRISCVCEMNYMRRVATDENPFLLCEEGKGLYVTFQVP